MATAIGSYAHAVTLESALAAALTFRGAEVHALLCDGAMTACAECEASLYPNLARFVAARPDARSVPRLPVAGRARLRAARAQGPSLQRLADRRGSRRGAAHRGRRCRSSDIDGFTLDGLAIGEHALRRRAALLRDRVARRRAAGRAGAAALSRVGAADGVRDAAAAARRSASRRRSFTHGIYVPWGIVGEVARQEGVHVSTWNVAYRKRRFIFSHDDTYHHTLMTEPREHWENLAADAGAGARADAVPREPARGAVRLDRVPPARRARTPQEIARQRRPRPRRSR